MKIIEPYAKMLSIVGRSNWDINNADRYSDVFTLDQGIELLKHIEWCARISHRSEDAVTEDSWKRIIKHVVLDHGDWSVVEHASVTVDAYVDRGITHEWVRHRLFSYTQECISGDSRISGNTTIRDAYQRNLVGKKIKSVHNGIVVNNKIEHIFSKGFQPVWLVTTKGGYRIKCTLTHEFQVSNCRFVRLEDLKIGDSIMVNGRPCLLSISNNKLTEDFLSLGLSRTEISNKYKVPYTSVGKRLRQLGINKLLRDNSNPEKFNKNHTCKSYRKMRRSILRGYRNGRTAWNKGLKEKDSRSVKIQADNLRKNHYNNLPGENNSNWKGGCRKTERLTARRKKENVRKCEVCGSRKRLEVHHIDENPSNNCTNNLLKLCYVCHKKVHSRFKLGIKAIPDEIVSILFVGYERVYDLEMSTYHNYIADGFVVHNSTRFVNYRKKMPPAFVQPLFDINTPQGQAQKVCWEHAMQDDEVRYQNMIAAGAAPQIARSVFPNALASRLIVTGNLRNWRHFFIMRTTQEAHPQMKQVTIPLLLEFKEKIPLLFDDLEPNMKQSIAMSRPK